MDTRQLQTFITLSETLNYQRAADQLSSVSAGRNSVMFGVVPSPFVTWAVSSTIQYNTASSANETLTEKIAAIAIANLDAHAFNA